MADPSVLPIQPAQSDNPEAASSAAKPAPNNGQPRNDAEPAGAEANAPSPNGGAPAGVEADAPSPNGGALAGAEGDAPSPNGDAPAGDPKPAEPERKAPNAQEILARLQLGQEDEDQPQPSAANPDPLKNFDEQRKKQAPATADDWRDAIGTSSAGSYAAYSSGGVSFGAGNTVGSVGAVIGGNQVNTYNYNNKSEAKKNLTPQRVKFDLQKLQAVFVEPPTYAKARQILAKQHLVVLRGPLHSGKWTTGLYLLQAKHGSNIDAIASYVTAKDFASLALVGQHAYIIDTINATSLPSITSSALRQLADRLQAIGSHAVLLVDSADPKNHIDEYLAPVDAISDPMALQILEKHVMWPLQHTPLAARARAVCQENDVKATLIDHGPHEVVVLAELLVEVARGKFDLAEALKRFKSSINQAVNWFVDHPKIEQRICMLAVAVLAGAECQQVLDAQYAFFNLMAQPTKDQAPTRAPVFDPRRSEWIGACRAQSVKSSKISAFGQSSVSRVVLKNERFRDEVLSYVWQEFDQLHGALLTWLRDLGMHSDTMVRNGAATAAGAFAKLDLEQVYREVLVPWAESERPEPQFAAALALAMLANDDEHVWDALRLTQDLSQSASEQRMLTAATAYGSIVGARFPEDALNDLATIAKHDSVDLAVAIYQSVVNLFSIGYTHEVFKALEKWTTGPKPNNLMIAGTKIFLSITDITFTTHHGKTWPRMLLLAIGNPTLCDVITKLWRRLLNTSWARRATLDVLHAWIVQSDTQPDMYPLVEQLVGELWARGTARERERLRFYLSQWAQQPTRQKILPAAARLLVAVIQIP